LEYFNDLGYINKELLGKEMLNSLVWLNILVFFLHLGWFLLSSSLHQNHRSVAQVVSEWIQLKDTSSCLTLWHHMDNRLAGGEKNKVMAFFSYFIQYVTMQYKDALYLVV